MIDTQKRTVNNNTVKHALSIKKKVEALRKSIVKKLFSVKRNSKINLLTFTIVVTKLTIINISIVKSLLNKFNHVQYSKSLNKIKRSLKNIFRNVIAKVSTNEFLI